MGRTLFVFAFWLVWFGIASAELAVGLLEEKSRLCRETLESREHVLPNPAQAREILLCAYSPDKDRIELFQIRSKTPGRTEMLRFSVSPAGYSVLRVRGRGITHFYFKITGPGGEEMIFLDGRHFDIGERVGALYFPFDNIFLGKEGVLRGYDFLLREIRAARDELCALGAKSKAYPGRALCELFDERFLAVLILIEQSDDGEFFNKCPAWDKLLLPENKIYESCPEYAVFKALTHFSRNREKAYSFVASRAKARGITQFMNTNKYPTYRNTVRGYPEAKLVADFALGMSDMKNAIKAAICYLDEILLALPRSAREKFREDFVLGGLFLIAGYNGGPDKAKLLYQAFHRLSRKNGRDLEINEFKPPQKTVRKETEGYIEKYLLSWPVIDKLDRWLLEGQY